MGQKGWISSDGSSKVAPILIFSIAMGAKPSVYLKFKSWHDKVFLSGVTGDTHIQIVIYHILVYNSRNNVIQKLPWSLKLKPYISD